MFETDYSGGTCVANTSLVGKTDSSVDGDPISASREEQPPHSSSDRGTAPSQKQAEIDGLQLVRQELENYGIPKKTADCHVSMETGHVTVL